MKPSYFRAPVGLVIAVFALTAFGCGTTSTQNAGSVTPASVGKPPRAGSYRVAEFSDGMRSELRETVVTEGSTPTAVWQTLDIVHPLGIETSYVVWRRTGVYRVNRVIEASGQSTQNCKPKVPELIYAFPLHVGARWLTDSSCTWHLNFPFLAPLQQPLAFDLRSVAAYVQRTCRRQCPLPPYAEGSFDLTGRDRATTAVRGESVVHVGTRSYPVWVIDKVSWLDRSEGGEMYTAKSHSVIKFAPELGLTLSSAYETAEPDIIWPGASGTHSQWTTTIEDITPH